jgi:hypothetical protein
MCTIKTLAVVVALTSAASASAHACPGNIDIVSQGRHQTIEVDDASYCSDTTVLQRGAGNGTKVAATGRFNTTRVNQLGANGKVDLRVDGSHTETHVFTGICPPGSGRWDVNSHRNDGLDILVLPCR